MEEWAFGTTIGDLKGLSQGSCPPFPTKTIQGVHPELLSVIRIDHRQGTQEETTPSEAPAKDALNHKGTLKGTLKGALI